MFFPDILDVFVVLFFCDFQWWREQLHDRCVLVAVGPVSCVVAILVTQVQVHILGYKQLNKVDVTLSSSDMEARKAALVFYLWVSSAVHELVHHVFHVFLSR